MLMVKVTGRVTADALCCNPGDLIWENLGLASSICLFWNTWNPLLGQYHRAMCGTRLRLARVCQNIVWRAGQGMFWIHMVADILMK